MPISDKSLRILHGTAGTFHLIQAIYAEVFVNTIYKNQGQFPLTNPVGTNINNLGTFQLTQLVPIFPFLSSLNHAWAVFDFDRYLTYVDKGYNPVRWIEYSMSASIMTFIIANLSGISDVKTLTGLVLANVAMQYTGYVAEKDTSIALKSKDLGILSKSHVAYENAMHEEIVGFIMLVLTFSVIGTSFFTNVADEGAPAFVWSIIFILFGLYVVFGVLSVMYARSVLPNSKKLSFRQVEVGYLVLSFVSKTFLTNMVLFGSVRPMPNP